MTRVRNSISLVLTIWKMFSNVLKIHVTSLFPIHWQWKCLVYTNGWIKLFPHSFSIRLCVSCFMIIRSGQPFCWGMSIFSKIIVNVKKVLCLKFYCIWTISHLYSFNNEWIGVVFPLSDKFAFLLLLIYLRQISDLSKWMNWCFFFVRWRVWICVIWVILLRFSLLTENIALLWNYA